MKSLANRMIDHVQNWKNYYLEDRDSLPAITPPATATFTPLPPTETPLPTPTPSPTLSPTSTNQPTFTAFTTIVEDAENGNGSGAWLWLLAVGIAGVAVYFVARSKLRG